MSAVIESGIPGGVEGKPADRPTVPAGAPRAIEGSCDHRGDPYPGYLSVTDPEVIQAWRERYEVRMTGYALRLPVLAVQGVLL